MRAFSVLVSSGAGLISQDNVDVVKLIGEQKMPYARAPPPRHTAWAADRLCTFSHLSAARSDRASPSLFAETSPAQARVRLVKSSLHAGRRTLLSS